MEAVATQLFDLNEVKKNATYSLPVEVWVWLKEEAAKRGLESGASGLIVDLVRKEQEQEARAA